MTVPFNGDWTKIECPVLPPYDADRLRKEEWERIFGPRLPKPGKP